MAVNLMNVNVHNMKLSFGGWRLFGARFQKSKTFKPSSKLHNTSTRIDCH